MESSKTNLLFEAETGVHDEHTYPWNWFSKYNVKWNSVDNPLVFDAVRAEVPVGRHHGATATHLYADGHVNLISWDQIAEWADEGTLKRNFVRPRQ